MKFLLDTSVLVDVLLASNQRRELLADLARAGHTLATTVLNVAELYSGMRPREEARTESFLSGLLATATGERPPGSPANGSSHGHKKGRILALAEALVAATLPSGISPCFHMKTALGMSESEFMERHFQVAPLDVERLLAQWRWLCPQPLSLKARNAFGDLFLRDEAGRILHLEVAIGRLMEIAKSEAQFLELSETKENREKWFAEADEFAAAKQGLKPNEDQCIGFKTPLVFTQSATPNQAFVADLYEQVSFLGDLHRQISKLPDGSKVRLKVKP